MHNDDLPCNEDGSPKRKDFTEWDEEEIVDYMVSWFRSQFVDPAEETPFAEGEYIYIWGGPYDASEEMHDAFHDMVDEELIEQAIDEVTSDGLFEWAPSSWHPAQLARAEEYELEQYEDWLRSHELLKLFISARAELEEFVKAHVAEAEQSIQCRMAFIQAWSILEAYLSGAIIKGVQESKQAMQALYEKNEDLKKTEFRGARLLAEPDAPEKVAIAYLSRQSYHNLQKVIPLFTAAFASENKVKLDVKDQMARQTEMLPARHDCVHRNGRNTSDEETEISQKDILDVLEQGQKLAEKLQSLIDSHIEDDDFDF